MDSVTPLTLDVMGVKSFSLAKRRVLIYLSQFDFSNVTQNTNCAKSFQGQNLKVRCLIFQILDAYKSNTMIGNSN